MVYIEYFIFVCIGVQNIMNYSEMNTKQLESYFKALDMEALKTELDVMSGDPRASVQKLIMKYRKKVEKYNKEIERIQSMWKYENELYQRGMKFVAGVDEAGRGPLAGPVYAAAVILPANAYIEGINDSKKLSEHKREELYNMITEKALAYSIASISEQEIDEINIRNAAYKAMVKAVQSLSISPEHVLIDGDAVKGMPKPYTCIVHGDSLSISIAAASILAKVSRDQYIQQMDEWYLGYGFAQHKGYGTKEHIEAIKKYGICPIHRKSFTSKFI